MSNLIISPKFRLWAYNVMAATMALLAGYGIVDGSKSALFNALAAAFFAVASAHVDTPGNHEKVA